MLSQLAIGSTVIKPYSFLEIGRLSEKQLVKAGLQWSNCVELQFKIFHIVTGPFFFQQQQLTIVVRYVGLGRKKNSGL